MNNTPDYDNNLAFESKEDSFWRWVVNNIDKDCSSYKHRTQAGSFIGWKYIIHLPNTKRPNPIEVIEFDDGLYYCGICAWVNRKTVQNILLALKEGLADENNN